MTINNFAMKNTKDCIHLNAAKKMKIKIDDQARILYVNDYFTNVTNFKVSDVILKDFNYILDPSMPKLAKDKLDEVAHQFEEFYFIYKGITKNEDCYWGFVKVTQRFNDQNEFVGYLLEVKMLPTAAINKIDKLYNVLSEIEKNAGIEAAKKYLDGFIEEKNMNFNEFMLALVEVDEKKAQKYFEIDEDASPVKKKKRGWF